MSSNKKRPTSPNPQAGKRKFDIPYLQNKTKEKPVTSVGNENLNADTTIAIAAATGLDAANTHVNNVVPHSGKERHKKVAKTLKRSKNSKQKGDYYSKPGSKKTAQAQDHELPALLETELKKPEQPDDLVEQTEADGKLEADDTVRARAATKIQAVYRGHVERKRYLQRVKNVIKVEALARGYLARRRFSQMRKEKNVPPVESEKETSATVIDSTEV